MMMTVCFGHCQRMIDAGLLAGRMAGLVKCEGSYTCDRFGPIGQLDPPTHTCTSHLHVRCLACPFVTLIISHLEASCE